ncbi:iron complex transport system permease protein [Paraburkholderia fungorum]|uniref:Iron complex transport system permease protein n=2 Tax=Paraburkholderia fungorum TaxID=134537 RepID=A0A1H1IRM4_9BURK|nr:iron ABC transporter permease [Paraburkholderia fungorum]SDR40006.1 iron complex transport system permease protein [Paraburkholderia fungorum]
MSIEKISRVGGGPSPGIMKSRRPRAVFTLFAGFRSNGARNPLSVMIALGALLCVSSVAAICLGAYRIAPTTLLAALWRPGALGVDPTILDQARAVLLSIRLPRVVLALIVGAGFGAAGSALQALLRNPLADPGLIGISSGAALGASLAIVCAPWLLSRYGFAGDGVTAFAAFAGALVVTALVYRLSARRGRLSLPVLLLSGIALNALAGATIGVMTYVASDSQLRSLTFWSLGSLAGVQWRTILILLPLVALSAALIGKCSRALNVMQLGEMEAHHLGVPVQRVKRVVLIAAALSVGAIVSCTGQIGFIGLVAPHCVRLVCGPDQRWVLPGSMLFGASLTVLSDLAARTIAAPAEVPLGILTALIGGPFFLALILRNRERLGA